MMGVIGIAVAMVALVAAAACFAALLRVRRRTEQVTELQQTNAQQIRQALRLVEALERRIAEAAKGPAASPAVPVVAAPVPAPTAVAVRKEREITPELLVILAAAATAFLGKVVRIRSAKKLQSPYEIVNPWSQQGRVFVQASHNLRPR